MTPGRGISMLVLNASRPLFRNNPNLRRAVNFAIDRKALVREAGPRFSIPADQYLQPSAAAYRDTRIYPFTPNLAKRETLSQRATDAAARLVFYTRDQPARARLRSDRPRQSRQDRVGRRGQGVSATCHVRSASEAAGRAVRHRLDRLAQHRAGRPQPCTPSFDGRTLDDARARQLVPLQFTKGEPPTRRGVAAHRGPSLYRAYGVLDAELARDFAPAVTFSYLNELTLVSARTACVVNTPSFDLAAACLR